MKKTITYFFLFIILLAHGLFFFAIQPSLALSANMTANEIQKIITTPQPAIHIPGLDFTNKTQMAKYTREEADGIYMYIPYLGEYISAVYKYAIVAAAVLVVIRIMDGGFGWVISGGNPEKIKKAQSKITQSLMGLFLTIFSYTLLYTINPNLVQFKNLQVKIIPTIDYNELATRGFDDGASAIPDTPTTKNLIKCPQENEMVDITGIFDISDAGIGIKDYPKMHKSLVEPLKRANLIAKEQGVEISIVSAGRTIEYQTKLWDEALKNANGDEEIADDYVTKPSCNAPHITGKALDLCLKGSETCKMVTKKYKSFSNEDTNKLQRIMKKAGWKRYCAEWWHFEYGLDGLDLRC